MRKRRLTAVTVVGSFVAAMVTVSVALAAPNNRLVVMRDACDGPSFNAALNDDEACLRPGGVTFDTFIGQLVAMQDAPAWRFAPGQATVAEGGTITAPNQGGEFHTFTEVAAFGGG